MSRSTFVSRRPLRAAHQPNTHTADRTSPAPDRPVAASDAHSRYGHRFSQISVTQPPIQREAEDEAAEVLGDDPGEGDELQMKADPATAPIQREAEEEEGGVDEEELQMKADPAFAPIQREAEDAGDEEDELQMKAEGTTNARPNVPVALGGGSALPAPVLSKMERSFGHSFADVRIHTGDEAKQVGALAYTRGANIHFQPGLYDPMSLGGQELLGHELTHVIQQRAGRVDTPQNKSAGSAPINADTALEGEADTMGARAARGQAAHVHGASGGGMQRKADVLQRSPEENFDTYNTGVGTLSDLGGIGSNVGTTIQDWSGASNQFHSITQAPSSITNADMGAGGVSMLGALSLPGAAYGAGKGIHEIYKGAKTGDLQRGLEGAGNTISNVSSMGGTVANMVQGGAFLSHAASLSGVAGGIAAPLGLATSTFGLGKSIYQGAKAQHGRNKLENLATDKTVANDQSLLKATQFASDMQRKKRNRAVLNTTSNALIAGGSAATLAGAAGAGVGAAVGVGLAGAGVGLKYGAMGLRKMKQGTRDAAAKREEDKKAGKKLGLWDRSVGALSDKIFKPNTEKTTAKKNAAYTEHTSTILGNKDVGSKIFDGLGATKSDLKKFEEYHTLKAKTGRSKQEDLRHAELEKQMTDRITSYMKARE